MGKAFVTWMVVLCVVAVAVALMGPLFVSMVAVDTAPEGVGIFLELLGQ